jgi:hypothetical protein
MSNRSHFVFSFAALSMLVAGCVAGSTESTEGADPVAPEPPGQAIGHEHLMLTEWARAEVVSPHAERASKTLTYYGGPVLTHVNVIPVYWNANVQYQSNLTSFYSYIVSSSIYTSLLPQYSSIGSGTVGTPFVGAQPSTGTFTDAQVQSYLNSLFAAGSIPAPNANNYYPVHFPAGVTIKDSSGASSCVTWCAYHGTYVRNGVNVNYGIIPDQGGGCAGGCGTNSLRVNNLTSVASHELVEATTDPAVGLATTYAPPLAWYNKTYGEIGDICNGQQATLGTWVVQKEWSNAKNACTTN